MRRVWLGVTLAALLVLSDRAGASSDHRVEQKNKAFSVAMLVIKPGDRVTFTNDDDTTHSLFFDKHSDLTLKRQEPGSSLSVSFNNPGMYEVRCNFHAKMKLMVVVKN